MAKQGQHNNDSRDSDKSRGHNNPDKSQTITTGSYKKSETYEKQKYEHKDPHKQGQEDKNEWIEDTRPDPAHNPATRARKGDITERDENKYTKG